MGSNPTLSESTKKASGQAGGLFSKSEMDAAHLVYPGIFESNLMRIVGIGMMTPRATPMLSLGIDIGFSKTVRSTGVCVIQSGDNFSINTDHVTTSGAIAEIVGLLGSRIPDVIAINGPLIPGPSASYKLVSRYRHCERVLSRDIFRLRCKPGSSRSPRGLALHRQATIVARALSRRYIGTPIVEVFPNGYLGVMLPDSAYVNKIRRQTKSDIFWKMCFEKRILPNLMRILYSRNYAKANTLLSLIEQHDERAAAICAIGGRGALRQLNFILDGGRDGALHFPPSTFIRPWARKFLKNTNDSKN